MRGKRKNKLQNDDWKKWKRNWPYKSLEDPKYIKERDETLRLNGNGWWRIFKVYEPNSEVLNGSS